MRTDRDFVAGYIKLLNGVDPAAREVERETLRKLALTELCLHLLASRLPGEDVGALPYLMLGYPKAVLGSHAPDVGQALASVRHLASRYISVAAWLDACRMHGTLPETFRCYAIVGRVPSRRSAAPASLLALLDAELRAATPWTARELKVAAAGEALVSTNRGETLLSYQVPGLPDRPVPAHKLLPRKRHAPIRLTMAELQAVAARVDAREGQPDWPQTLPPLRLQDRLSKLSLKGIDGHFFDGETLTLKGAVHVLGMLSSGKSTLVWLILFALAAGEEARRVGMLVTDTIQGANVVARLRRHGVPATVLSSFRNRERHLNSMHWQQGLSRVGWSLGAIGDLAENFSVACPLDGFQAEPLVVRGSSHNARFPEFREKPCHKLFPQRRDAERLDGAALDEELGSDVTRSCPLWSVCPSHEQQRMAVDARVVVLTPQAFVHMTPDKWTAASHLTLPELFQFEMDLVIIDEVDSVQKVMDDIFAPRSPIMGDEHDVYAPAIGTRSSEALRERSGHQFRRQVNAKWQANFHTFYRLIGSLYALLQNESADLQLFYRNTPFTAGGILYEIWRRRQEVRGLAAPGRSFDDPAFEEDFLEVIKVASAISGFSRATSVALDDHDAATPTFRDRELRDAAEALAEIAREAVVADYYEDLAERIEAQLDGPLRVFNATGENRAALGRRGNALALLLAVISELVLMHYYWLVKAQPAVATDFGIDDAQLLSQANNLLKHYRTLLPANPAGGVFGLLYDEPPPEKRHSLGGKLTLINHLGVGRHLITHLHDLLAAEGQAGPHVLMLSGTSWAGGSRRRLNPRTGRPMDAASPSFDVQVPAQGVLMQPPLELEAINRSSFELVPMRKPDGSQIRISGLPERERRSELAEIAQRLGTRRDELNLIESGWQRMAQSWGVAEIEDRRRVLLVTNSYADAAVVADSLLEALEGHGYADWKVFSLARDRADDEQNGDERRLRRARELPRSLIERFGEEPERSVLVAPMQIVARGHNILNAASRAAISSIYFLHRPHPRPDDLSSVIGRLNRFAEERFDRGMSDNLEQPDERLAQKARRMRYAATNIVRYSLYSRGGYSELSAEYKAQFAWDMLTPLWQTIGRGIRNGCPIHIGFIDRQFAPMSYEEKRDTPDSSVLVQAIRQLELSMRANEGPDAEVPELLYRPFLDALSKTRGLIHA
jgi:hypothetical protein